MDIQLPKHCGSLLGNPHSGLTTRGLWGNPRDLATGNVIVMENGGGVCNNQHWDNGRLISYLQCPSSSPTQQLYLQSQDGDAGIVASAARPDSQPQTKSLDGPGAWYAPA